jgi:hypothetical protein
MADGYPPNCAQIILHPIENDRIKLDVTPDVANCKAVWEDMVFIVDWSKGKQDWVKVEVCNLTDENGHKPDSFPLDLEFTNPNKADIELQKIKFVDPIPKEQKRTCKYEVHFHRRTPSQVIVLDPTVILRPGDWVPGTGG